VNKIAIITSIDYELFGDGSGNVSREQINTTNYLRTLVEPHDVKLTIMFEYAQYRIYKKYEKEFPKLAEDNKKIEKQLIELIQAGHDVQLHYHAQWHNAIYDKELEVFNVVLEEVDISSLDYSEIVSVLKEGKEFLEKLLQPYREEYRCIAFRAGSWAVKDEKKMVRALLESDFKVDTSVVPDVEFNEGFVDFRYLNCPSNYHYWYVDDKLSKQGAKQNLLEIPIYTIKSRLSLLKHLSKKSILVKLYIKQKYKNNIYNKSKLKYNFFAKIKKKIYRNYYMADINIIKSKVLIDMIERVIDDSQYDEENIIPIMMVGHSKASYKMEDMHDLYEYLSEKYGDNVEYCTLQEASNYLMDK